MDLALKTYKGWYAIKPNQPNNQQIILFRIIHLFAYTLMVSSIPI